MDTFHTALSEHAAAISFTRRTIHRDLLLKDIDVTRSTVNNWFNGTTIPDKPSIVLALGHTLKLRDTQRLRFWDLYGGAQ